MNDSYHHGDLRRAMIKKGMEMLSREGIEKFSMRKLASELGVSHTAPYRHFKNKEEAVEQILLENSNAFTQALGEAIEEEGTAYEKLIRLGLSYVNFFVEHPEFLKFFMIISDQAAILEALFPLGGKTSDGKTISHCVAVEQLEMETHITGSDYEALPVNSSYGIFRDTAAGLFDQFPNLSEREVLLGYWSKVHGLASLLIAQPDYIPPEKRREVIERILKTPF